MVLGPSQGLDLAAHKLGVEGGLPIMIMITMINDLWLINDQYDSWIMIIINTSDNLIN